ncbi:hypothetical protein O206_19610 [Ochrobactrum sp. EGD-AQ16]|nr:hypothetical protein O206_19610 [Ochrobactrum sp. EGD-AQ16]
MSFAKRVQSRDEAADLLFQSCIGAIDVHRHDRWSIVEHSYTK